jgi:hypothetical protein
MGELEYMWTNCNDHASSLGGIDMGENAGLQSLAAWRAGGQGIVASA